MQKQIIPTILVQTFKEVEEKIRLVEDYVEWVQIDVMDGIFVKNTTWNNPNDLVGIKIKTKTEIHLMIENPEEVIDEWLQVADRIIVHFESKITNLNALIKNVHNNGKQIGLAINPETDYEVVKPFLNELDLVLLMTVSPGDGGQQFDESVLNKIKALQEIWPNGSIEVDGGINDKNIKRIAEAGADIFNVGTYIYDNQDIKQAIYQLTENLKRNVE
ncbi:MAG: ribulose-phosphate 3-epimerase [Candidatus Portnoybacteria bacterium]|nr:ribulose-phosphate 3-epimerase [Candidatus Portnoybacteria bacterium]